MRRGWPLLLLLLALGAWFAFDFGRWLDIQTLARSSDALRAWSGAHPVAAPLAFVAAYAAIVALSVPGATIMTMAGGLMFGAWSGGLYAVIGATLGASLLFLVARTSVGTWLSRRAGPRLRQLQAGFGEHALSYLLALRLIPLFPFFLVNLAPALLGMRLREYVVATFFGIMPATFIYALAGSGVGDVLARARGIGVADVMSPQIVVALSGLALLALLPAIARRRGWLASRMRP